MYSFFFLFPFLSSLPPLSSYYNEPVVLKQVRTLFIIYVYIILHINGNVIRIDINTTSSYSTIVGCNIEHLRFYNHIPRATQFFSPLYIKSLVEYTKSITAAVPVVSFTYIIHVLSHSRDIEQKDV